MSTGTTGSALPALRVLFGNLAISVRPSARSQYLAPAGTQQFFRPALFSAR